MTIRSTLLALVFSLAAPALAGPGGGKGTDVLHLTARAALTGTGVDADADGGVTLMLRQQGHADIQTLRLELSGLGPDAGYTLWALLRGALAPVETLAFDADADGAASLQLMRGGLPPALDPLVDVLALEVRDGADQVVLLADLVAPDFLQYLVKRRLDNDGVDDDAAGSLLLKATTAKASFRLSALGLDPNADYTLVIDGTSLATLTTDDAGRLQARELPGGAPEPLDIERIELHDGADQSVLSAELP